VAGIAPVLMEEMGAGALSRLRAEGLSSRREARRRFAPRPVRHRAGRVCAVAHIGAARVQRQARWSSPARCLDAAAGRRLMACRLLADGLTRCLAAGTGRVTLLIT
jgi:hypothetical protein